MTILKKIWAGWKFIAHKIGVFNTKLLLTITYFLMISLISLVVRLLGRDLLDKRFRPRPSYWHPKEPVTVDLERCRRQF